MNKNATRSLPVILFTALTMLFSSIVYSAIDNIRFERLGVDEGLTQRTITTIFQDSTGFMWFGTQEGLNRYDGMRFINYRHSVNDPSSISNAWVTSISEDINGRIWVGTRDGLNILDVSTGNFIRSFQDSSDSSHVYSVFKDKQNAMWVLFPHALYRFDEQKNVFEKFAPPFYQDNPAKLTAKVIADDGHFYIGTNKNFILSFDPVSKNFEKIDIQYKNISASKSRGVSTLLLDSSGNLWLGSTANGAFKIDEFIVKSDKVMIAEQIAPLAGKQISHLLEDINGTMWFASGTNGLSYLAQDGSFETVLAGINSPIALSSNVVNYLYQDNGEVFWVGTFSGIDKWNTATTKFDHYRVRNQAELSLVGSNVTAIEEYTDNKVFVGTDAGLSIVDTSTNLIENLLHDASLEQSLSENRVMAIETISREEVWFGYRVKGASVYNPVTNEFKHFPFDKNNPTGLSAKGVTDILHAQDGSIWLSTFEGGLNKYIKESDSFKVFKHDKDDMFTLSSNQIISLHETRSGLIWIGTWNQGINIFNPKTESVLRVNLKRDGPQVKAPKSILSIYEDSRGNMWFGTQGDGLNMVSAESIQNGEFVYRSFNQQEGMPSNVVYGILEDGKGYIWASTNRGLIKMNPSDYSITEYKAAQGLLGVEFNSGAATKTSEKQMFFGGPKGVTAFFPSKIKPNEHVPPTVITQFQRLNEFYNPSALANSEGVIEIGYQDYLIGFEFAGLDFVSPKDNKYKYRLKGFDQDWVNAFETRRATYTNLPAGNYEFQVIASNSDGVWNNQGETLKLKVHPAPWLSPWAYGVYISVIIIAIGMTIRFQLRKNDAERKYRETLEAEVSARTKELQQLNKKLLSASITDQLTGLHNRRYLADVLPQRAQQIYDNFKTELKKDIVTSTSGPRLFFLMFDLDGFKPINDTYGHDAGDKVIIQVAELLKEVCRVNDIVIRWGGDEFLIVGEINDISEVSSLAERVRTSIAGCGFNIGLSQRMHVSSSMGFSVYPFSLFTPDALSWEQVHLLADNALYKSKDAGRNTWTGIVQTDHSVPFSDMNSISSDIEKAINEDYVQVIRHQPDVFKSSKISV